ncbi:cytochrome c oxidase assembly factor 2, partial [Lecanoromycetidae sp. Uapishka_2]
MTPHLHPRSRLTTSLFGTTLLVSFLVVGMPHILPCPVPRVKYADSEFEISEDGKRRRRRGSAQTPNGIIAEGERGKIAGQSMSKEERDVLRKKSHECPVPKPRGRIGEVLGFRNDQSSEKLPKPIVETKPSKFRKEID